MFTRQRTTKSLLKSDQPNHLPLLALDLPEANLASNSEPYSINGIVLWQVKHDKAFLLSMATFEVSDRNASHPEPNYRLANNRFGRVDCSRARRESDHPDHLLPLVHSLPLAGQARQSDAPLDGEL